MHALNLHAVLPRSRANGPGIRTAIWVQGCSLQCPGCFNPETHAHEPRLLVQVEPLVRELEHAGSAIEGITISGGEPLEQPHGLVNLLRRIRERTRLSVILFSGYTLPEIERMPHADPVLARVDVLVAGRFVGALRRSHGLRGSSNQTIHLLSDRYRLHEVEESPVGEISIDRQGAVSVTGIDPPRVWCR
jgi:anaerobic ribonucleoside-triphosphate reductase activating protein